MTDTVAGDIDPQESKEDGLPAHGVLIRVCQRRESDTDTMLLGEVRSRDG